MTDPQIIHYVFALLVGALAGGINTLAGSGSAITLPMLMFLGLDANVANGTNRVGVLIASLVGAETFRRQGALKLPGKRWLIGAASAGAVLGAAIATSLSPAAMQHAITVVMVLMLILIVTKPSRWMREDRIEAANHKRFSTLAIFFAIGVYAGFIQIGAGVFLLAALVLHEHYSLTQSNALKLIIVLALSVPALMVFILSDDVDWPLGILLAIGQAIGAFVAARFATRHPDAKVWMHRLLIVIVVFCILKLSGALSFVTG